MANDIYNKDDDLGLKLREKLFGSNKPEPAFDPNVARKSISDVFGGQPSAPKPMFAGTRNMVQAKDNVDYNEAQQDMARRNALQAAPAAAGMMPPSVPNPYIQPAAPKLVGQDAVPPMVKPQIQTQEMQAPSMQMNQPLDNEDLKNLGLMPK